MPRKKDPIRSFKIVPTSCRCGGSLAWVEIIEQPGGARAEMMIGCICHYTPYFLTNVPLWRGSSEAPPKRAKPPRKAHAQTATPNSLLERDPIDKEIH